MIAGLLCVFLLIGIVFFFVGIFTRNLFWRLGLSLLAGVVFLGFGLTLLSRIDAPPAGTRPVTQEELDRAAGIEDEELEKEITPNERSN
jgi:cytochrome c biogenesis protein CcdA